MGRLMTELCPHRWHHHTAGITTVLSRARAAGVQPLRAGVMELALLLLLFLVLCHSTCSFTLLPGLTCRTACPRVQRHSFSQAGL